MRKHTVLLVVLFLCSCITGFVAAAEPTFAGTPPCADTVNATVVGNAIHVYHGQAEWNCCAQVVFELNAHADTLDLYESEVYEIGPCHCLCCFDLQTTITGVAAGDYLVRVLAAVSGELFGEVWVQVQEVVPGGGVAGSGLPGTVGRWGQPEAIGVMACAAELGGTLQSPCGGWGTGVAEPDAVTTWGRIKVLYR